MSNFKRFAFSAAFFLILCLLANVLTVFAATVPVPNANVSTVGNNTGDTGSTTSDSNGNYRITNAFLETDTYNVTASATGFIDTTISNVLVTAGSETSGQNILMPVSGGISGKVTDAIGGAPLSAYVYAKSGSYTGYSATDSNGNYQIITNLDTGTYNVSATTVYNALLGIPLAAGYLDHTQTSVSVTRGVMTSNINLAMAHCGSIAGTLTDSVTNAPQSGDYLAVRNAVTGAYIPIMALTNSTGGYVLNTNLATGTYNVSVTLPCPGHLPKTVGPISVTAGAQTIQNIAIDPSGGISGQVTSGGQGVSGASVRADSNDFVYYGGSTTDSNGNYLINSNLGTGTYTVSVSYRSATNQATGVSVAAGATTSGVNIALTIPATGSITGTVTSTHGGGIPYANVDAVGTSTYVGGLTDSSGNYNLTDVAPGVYTVTASGTGYTSSSQYPVTVTANVVTSGVNLQLAPKPTGIISGQVQTNGTPLPEFKREPYMLVVLSRRHDSSVRCKA